MHGANPVRERVRRSSIMEHRFPRTSSLVCAQGICKAALATIAGAAALGLAGCGSRSIDTATATALFRQTVAHHYGMNVGRCERTAASRWTCTAHINDPGEEIDVDVYGAVRNLDGTLVEYGHTRAR
jgi:hypothetical protein